MFTSGVNDPPNLATLLQDPTSYKIDMLSLWSGKSSHFKFIMEADSFDFSKSTFTHDGKWAPAYAARVTKDFAPAHSIPLSRLEASGIDDYITSSTAKWIINPSKAESYEGSGFTLIESPTGGLDKSAYPYALAAAAVSAVHIDGWRRGGRNAAGRQILRSDVNKVHLIHSGIVREPAVSENANGVGGVVEVGRNTIRRRNYKNLLPTKGYYDRTGFNMPISWDSSTIEYSYLGGGNHDTDITGSGFGFLPLGLIASAGYYAPIDDYMNLPLVYKKCEHLNSPNIFSGVVTSSTFPCRGLSALGADGKHTQYRTSPANYVDRGQTSDIVATMHAIQERRKLEKARYYVSSNFDSFSNNYDQFNPELSFSNSSTESDGWFPDAISDYHNYEFGRGLHQVYDFYTDNFNRHGINLINADQEGGPLIHAHLYGNGLFNGNFEVTGPYSTLHGNPLIASSIPEVSSLNLSHPMFSGVSSNGEWTGSFYGSHIVSAGSLIASSTSQRRMQAEIRNKNILSGVELIHVSGADTRNSFELYNIAPSLYRNNRGKNYYISNTLIKLKSIKGLSRLRLSVKEASGLGAYSSYYPRNDNVLSPDHKYRLNIRYLGGTEDGRIFGGVKVGAWIHTEIENDTFWSYTRANKWEKADTSSISEDYILNNSYYHIQPTTKHTQVLGRCGKVSLLNSTTSSNPSIISEFIEDDYSTLEVEFHTFNKGLQRRELGDEPYGIHFSERPKSISEDLKQRQKTIGDLHTENQNYVIEFFMVPDNDLTKFVLVDHIGLLDRTLSEKITYDVSGDWHPAPFSILRRGNKYLNPTEDTYTPEDIRTIFNFFNSTVGANHFSPYASRVALETSGTYGTSGGGRLSYRQQPEYYTYTKDTTYNNFTELKIED